MLRARVEVRPVAPVKYEYVLTLSEAEAIEVTQALGQASSGYDTFDALADALEARSVKWNPDD